MRFGASDMDTAKWDAIADAYNAVDKCNRIIQRNIKEQKRQQRPIITLAWSAEAVELVKRRTGRSPKASPRSRASSIGLVLESPVARTAPRATA